VDGGVNLENVGKLLNSGADVLVTGNSIFASGNPISNIKEFKKLTRKK
jgi:ribulose-phosphate 3-epimerase